MPLRAFIARSGAGGTSVESELVLRLENVFWFVLRELATFLNAVLLRLELRRQGRGLALETRFDAFTTREYCRLE